MTKTPNLYPLRRLMWAPLLRELWRRGGAVRPGDANGSVPSVYDTMAKEFEISEAALKEQMNDRGRLRSKWENHIRWVRQDCVDRGWISNENRGVWKITDAGQGRLTDLVPDEVVEAPETATQSLTQEALEKLLLLQAELGEAGEAHVVSEERRRLLVGGRADLADKVLRMSKINACAGFDVLSFEIDESPRYIEVKTSRNAESRFFLSANEIANAKRYGAAYWLYRVVMPKDGVVNVSTFSDLYSRIAAKQFRLIPQRFAVIQQEEGQ